MGDDALGPSLAYRPSFRVAQVQTEHPTGVGVEAGRQDQHVDVVIAGCCANPCREDLLDGRGTEIDEVHVLLVERFVVPLFEWRSLGSEGYGGCCGASSSATRGSAMRGTVFSRQ